MEKVRERERLAGQAFELKPEEKEHPQSEKCLKQVAEILGIYRGMRSLTCVILATLVLPGNEQVFKDLPEGWHELVKDWRQRCDELEARLVEAGEVVDG